MYKKTILVVEDSEINRKLLRKILENQYEIIEAENGEIGIDILEQNKNIVSAVILDIVMPVCDGFEFLLDIRKNKVFEALPILVVSQNDDSSNEQKALEYGATDFIAKPYQPAIIRQRLANTLILNEAAARKNNSERDNLTWLYNKHTFFKKVSEALQKSLDFDVMTIDIEKFKLINELFGSLEGDKLLKYTAQCLKNLFGENDSVIGRLDADNFAVFVRSEREKTENGAEMLQRMLADYPLSFRLKIYCGIYKCDADSSVGTMCDRAKMAADTIKHSYNKCVAYYDEAKRISLLEEEEIAGDMIRAIDNKQFEVVIQPKFNLTTHKVVGGEALIRWHHPTKGIIPPDKFVKIFEKNGFITKLDQFVWETTARYIRDTQDKGIRIPPISVNISRVDVFNPNLCEIIDNIARKYDLEKEMLELEITETSYSEDPQQLIEVANELKSMGFRIAMDDFGSGYSSLTMINEIPFDTIKLDMGFLKSEELSKNRSGNIIEFVVTLAKWLGIPVIAEGIETIQQASFLRSIGCNIGQGYYFSQPITLQQFENMVVCSPAQSAPKERMLYSDNADIDELWKSNSQFNLIFNSFVGALAIVEQKQNKLMLARANDKYYDLFKAPREFLYHLSPNILDLFDAENKLRIKKILHTADRENNSIEDVIKVKNFGNGKENMELRVAVKTLSRSADRTLFLCSIIKL